LGIVGWTESIETIPKRGYRFVALSKLDLLNLADRNTAYQHVSRYAPGNTVLCHERAAVRLAWAGVGWPSVSPKLPLAKFSWTTMGKPDLGSTGSELTRHQPA